MEKVFTTRYGTLMRIYERDGKKYVRLSELAQGLGYSQYNTDGTLAKLIAGQGLQTERQGKYHELELTAARKLVEAFILNRRQARQWDQETLGKEILTKLKNEQVGISLFEEPAKSEKAEAEPADNMSEVIIWAAAISERYGLSPSEALKMAERAIK